MATIMIHSEEGCKNPTLSASLTTQYNHHTNEPSMPVLHLKQAYPGDEITIFATLAQIQELADALDAFLVTYINQQKILAVA